MPSTCVFCGSAGPLTKEHVFGKWVGKTGLDITPTDHHAGPLNALPRHLGLQPPYRQMVKDVCSSCNNGWMSKLETVAQRVLTPLILGQPGTIAPNDHPILAMWAQKTALTAMLLSTEEQRNNGYGLDPAEYRALYANRERMQPLDASQVWIGQFDDNRPFSAVRVTPLTVRTPGLAEPELPQAYAASIVLGAVMLHSLRFTTPAPQAAVTMLIGFPQLWPSTAPVQWPGGQICTKSEFLRLADAHMLRAGDGNVQLRPWTHAAHLPQSTFEGGTVKVPALCRIHDVHYPVALLQEARHGRYYAFMVACDCAAYLIHTDSDRVRFRGAGEADGITQMYEDTPGEEYVLSDHNGQFVCKRLPA